MYNQFTSPNFHDPYTEQYIAEPSRIQNASNLRGVSHQTVPFLDPAETSRGLDH